MYVFRTKTCHPRGRQRPGRPERLLPWSAVRKEPVMIRAFLPKAVLLLVLILLLATPALQAAEPGTPAKPVRNMPSALASWGTQVWDFLTGVWAANGCILEPNGRCLPSQSPAAEADNGCRIEPNGGCGS